MSMPKSVLSAVSKLVSPFAPASSPALQIEQVRPRREKDLGVETLRGLAIILMVMGHVIGDTAAAGLRVAEESTYRHVYFMLQYLRMPLFTVISGFVYSMLPVVFATSPKFVGRKFERLFLPLLTIGTVQYVLHSVVPGTNVAPPLNEVWTLYVYSHDQFWFLHSIFLVFMTMVFLDGFRLMDRVPSWAGCLAVASLLSLYGPRSEIFSFTGFLYLLPFFVLGCGLYRFAETIFRREVVLPLIAVFGAGLCLQHLIYSGRMHFDDERINWVSLLVGISGTIVLFALRKPVRWLAWLGSYAYGIFLMHVFPVAGSRIALMRVGMRNREVLFAVGLACGLIVPIVFETFIRKNTHLTRYLLGERTKPAVAKALPPHEHLVQV